MKAVLITKTNVDFLASRFSIEDIDIPDRLPIDFILVTDFGNDENFDVLTKTKFNIQFDATGVKLDNDFFEVEKK